jgi:uncharacterized phage protein (TIGR01671 family)
MHLSQPNANTNVVGSLLGQREIKFRAWHPLNKEMVYPIKGQNFGYGGYTRSDILRDFEDENIMQFTGLKDNNGKEIYEGDIVHYDTEDGVVRAKVVFALSEEENMNISGFVFEFICHEDYTNEDESVDLEVIGNIYENPELLQALR